MFELRDVMEDPQRTKRLALLLAWRALRTSISRGRPISLPNVLRLHRRLGSDLQTSPTDLLTDQRLIESRYREFQPFANRPGAIG
jgi:hypothetical protein